METWYFIRWIWFLFQLRKFTGILHIRWCYRREWREKISSYFLFFHPYVFFCLTFVYLGTQILRLNVQMFCARKIGIYFCFFLWFLWWDFFFIDFSDWFFFLSLRREKNRSFFLEVEWSLLTFLMIFFNFFSSCRAIVIKISLFKQQYILTKKR